MLRSLRQPLAGALVVLTRAFGVVAVNPAPAEAVVYCSGYNTSTGAYNGWWVLARWPAWGNYGNVLYYDFYLGRTATRVCHVNSVLG